MIIYGHGIVGYVLTLISLIHGLSAFVTSFTVVVIVIHHQYNNRLKREEKISLVLFTNIYILIFSYSITLLSINIPQLLGDVYGYNFESSWCIFKGYFTLLMCCGMYHAFVIQAFFRLCRIVYSNYRWLQLFWFYLLSTPLQLIVASVLLSPLLILHDVIYLPNDHDCSISFINVRGVVYTLIICYGLPLIYLSLIYIRITLFIRKQPNYLALGIRRRQKRDLLAIQRIFINVGLLITLGFPCIVLFIMALITSVEYPLTFRILWLGAEMSTAFLSIEMVLMTPQLRNVVMKRWQQNRVGTIEGSIQMRPVITAQ